jgi:hypothetical protein
VLDKFQLEDQLGDVKPKICRGNLDDWRAAYVRLDALVSLGDAVAVRRKRHDLPGNFMNGTFFVAGACSHGGLSGELRNRL